MIVLDMSKSMEETDLPRDRMDAAQYEAELERLLTELALVSRSIRAMEANR